MSDQKEQRRAPLDQQASGALKQISGPRNPKEKEILTRE